VAAGLVRAASMMSPDKRELAPRLKAAIAASAELQERNALKNATLGTAMATALVDRGIPEPTAAVAAELGLLAFGRAYSTWSQTDGVAEDDLATYALTALDELRTAAAALD
jgi:hypothetical protein